MTIYIGKDILQNIPSQNSASNNYVRDVMGNKNDDNNGDSLYSFSYKMDKHFHSPAMVYPTLANATVISKANSSAWGLDASPTEIIPASTITSPFDIHYVNIGAISNNDQYELILFSGAVGAETEIARVSFDRSVTATEGSIPCQTIILSENSRISAKLTSSATLIRSISVKLNYNIY